MQFNISKKNFALGLFFALIAFVIGFLLANRNADMDGMGMHSGMDHGEASSSDFSTADLHFAQMMIPHHQQAIEMSDLAMKNSQNPQILDLAKKIKAAQGPEIDQMKSWLTKSGLDANAPHSMMMGGMLSDSDMDSLKKAQGVTFDKLFLSGMISHHEGAIAMAQMIDESENSEVKALAQSIISSQTAEIAAMKSLLIQLK